MGKKIKVRFNLGRGENYMKWKIEYPSGQVSYYSPADIQLVMSGCTLKNSKKTAEKIYNGEHKTVCAWVLCDDIQVRYGKFESFDEFEHTQRLMYNPRRLPHWTLDNISKINLDGTHFEKIGTVDSQLYKL